MPIDVAGTQAQAQTAAQAAAQAILDAANPTLTPQLTAAQQAAQAQADQQTQAIQDQTLSQLNALQESSRATLAESAQSAYNDIFNTYVISYNNTPAARLYAAQQAAAAVYAKGDPNLQAQQQVLLNTASASEQNIYNNANTQLQAQLTAIQKPTMDAANQAAQQAAQNILGTASADWQKTISADLATLQTYATLPVTYQAQSDKLMQEYGAGDSPSARAGADAWAAIITAYNTQMASIKAQLPSIYSDLGNAGYDVNALKNYYAQVQSGAASSYATRPNGGNDQTKTFQASDGKGGVLGANLTAAALGNVGSPEWYQAQVQLRTQAAMANTAANPTQPSSPSI